MRLKDVGYMYSGLTGKSGDDFRCEELAKTKAFVPFTNILNNFVVDFNQFKRVWMTKGEQQNQVCEGDLLFLMSSEDYESIGKSAVVIGNPGEVYLNSFCRGFRFYSYNTINPKFVNYQLSSDLYRDNLRFEARGFTRINLKVDRVESARISLPSLFEQNRIVAYLDEKTAAIDKQVSLLEQKKEKYTLLRKSIIKKAVTEGLNHTVQKKDSGIDWLGQIPRHWIIKRIKNLFYISRGRVIPLTELQDDGLYPVYSSQTENDGCMGCINTYDYDGTYLTWTTDGVYAGTVFLRKGRFNCTNICGILKPQEKICMRYAFWGLSIATPHNKRIDTNGAKIMSNEMAIIQIPVPPLSEQRAIADYLDEKCAKIDAIVANINQQIEKYKLLRRALINEVVTGKKII